MEINGLPKELHNEIFAFLPNNICDFCENQIFHENEKCATMKSMDNSEDAKLCINCETTK